MTINQSINQSVSQSLGSSPAVVGREEGLHLFLHEGDVAPDLLQVVHLVRGVELELVDTVRLDVLLADNTCRTQARGASGHVQGS